MRRIWTLVSAAVVFVAMAVTVGLAPTGFVSRAPGVALDVTSQQGSQPVIEVDGAQPLPQSGLILAASMVQSGQDERVSLLRLVIDYFLPNHEVLPRDNIYPSGQTAGEAADDAQQAVQSSRAQAMAAAVTQSGGNVIERPEVVAVRQSGPSYQKLFPGDLIVAIDNTPVQTDNDVLNYIRNNKQIGDQVVVTVLRGAIESKVTIDKLVGSSTDMTVPSIGVSQWGTGYSYSPSIQIATPAGQADPAQGLPLALATYDLLTGNDATGGKIIAAAGQIAADGTVSAVSGINEYATSAANAGATVFLIPSANCSDINDTFHGMAIVPVADLDGALTDLNAYNTAGTALPQC